MPSSERARSSTASTPCLRSRTSASSASLRALSSALVCRCPATWALSSRTRNQPPFPSHIGYCSPRMTSAKTMASQRIGRSVPLYELMERRASRIMRDVAQVFFDAQQLVVFGDSVGARQRSGLDLSCVGSHGDVGDETVFGFARTVRDYRRVAGADRHADRCQRLREGADLVYLDQDRVGHAFGDSLLEDLGIGHEDIVTDELCLRAQTV